MPRSLFPRSVATAPDVRLGRSHNHGGGGLPGLERGSKKGPDGSAGLRSGGIAPGPNPQQGFPVHESSSARRGILSLIARSARDRKSPSALSVMRNMGGLAL